MKQRRQKKTFVSIIVYVLIIILAVFGLYFIQTQQKKAEENKFRANFEKQILFKPEAITASSPAAPAFSLVEFKFDKEVITAVIENPDELEKEYPFFSKAYKGDIIITSPQKTVIFDPSTNSIRDVSTVSLFERLKNK